MLQFGGKNAKKSSSDSKRHFTVVMGGKEHGIYISSTPSSAAKKAVTKLCSVNKSKKVEFHIREITQGSKKKTYGPYNGYIEKLKEPIELKGRIIRYKPFAKLSEKNGKKMKGGLTPNGEYTFNDLNSKLSEISIRQDMEDIEKELTELFKYSNEFNRPKNNKENQYFSNALEKRKVKREVTKRIELLVDKIKNLMGQLSNQQEIDKLKEIDRKIRERYPNRFTKNGK